MKSTINKKNVVGIARGEKWTNGKSTGQPAVLVFVEKKEPLGNLSADDIIEDEIDGLPTDVVGKTGRISALGIRPQNLPARPWVRASRTKKRNPKKRTRPIMGGISISHRKVTAGTLGVLCRDKKKQVVLLSNNHVIANTNKAKIGDPIYQPGTYDSRRKPKNAIGYLAAFTKLKNGVNQDSAIARVKTSFSKTINRIGRPKRKIRGAKVGLKVIKSGRTTGVTKGKIIAKSGTFRVWYGSNRSYKIKSCIVTTGMSAGGDSGSLLMDRKRRPIGLLFAGSSAITLHSPIKPILKRYKISIL